MQKDVKNMHTHCFAQTVVTFIKYHHLIRGTPPHTFIIFMSFNFFSPWYLGSWKKIWQKQFVTFFHIFLWRFVPSLGRVLNLVPACSSLWQSFLTLFPVVTCSGIQSLILYWLRYDRIKEICLRKHFTPTAITLTRVRCRLANYNHENLASSLFILRFCHNTRLIIFI